MSNWNVLVIGDSNANSTQADTVHGGQPVPAGWTYMHNGSIQLNWSAYNSPGVAMLPHLIEQSSACGGALIRRGKNGSTAAWADVGPLWNAAVGDVALTGSVPDLVLLVLGANDGKTLAKSNAYQANMSVLLDLIEAQWPEAQIALWRERVTNGSSGIYPYLRSTVYAAQDALAAAYPLILVDGTILPAPDLFDGIHWSVSQNGNGHGEMVQRMMPLLGL